MREDRTKAENNVDSSAWTGSPPPRAKQRKPKRKPKRLSKWQIVATTAIWLGMTVFAWMQVYSLLTTGTVAARHGRVADPDEAPLAFIFHTVLWLGIAGVSVWVGLRIATSATTRKRMINAARNAWRDAR